MKKQDHSPRRQQILECIAAMLETGDGQRITTARLAEEVGVSEAALYRHFPSKARMFEGLIEFVEETIFSRISLILTEESTSTARCGRILTLVLTFAARNPGLTRILTRDALGGEQQRLKQRVAQFFERLETQIKQILREAPLREGAKIANDPSVLASLFLAVIEGRLQQFVRSGFKRSPVEGWDTHWVLLQQMMVTSRVQEEMAA